MPKNRRWIGVDPTRSKTMSSVKKEGTQPEMAVRQVLHRSGYRYRLHASDLPGKPDIVFRKRRKIIFVHGCFWHGHNCAHGLRQPRTNRAYWSTKIERNKKRDASIVNDLELNGWEVFTVWECETSNADELGARLKAFLGLPNLSRPPQGSANG